MIFLPYVSLNASAISSRESSIIEGTDITVGTPTAITLRPRLAAFSVLRLFPTPEPGLIPVSVICIVVLRRLLLLAARASTAITASASILSQIPLTISRVSIPVCAITPGHIALKAKLFSTPLTSSKSVAGSRCLVINRLSTTRGPMESGVT